MYVHVECLEVLQRFASLRCSTYISKQTTLHNMNKHGGFGDLHSAEPYGVEAYIVKSCWADSDNDTPLSLNNFTDHCPELTEKQLHSMNGFEKLPFYPCQGHKASCAWLCTQNKPFEPSSGATLLVRVYPEVSSKDACWAMLKHQRFEMMWTPRGRAECFYNQAAWRSAQSMLLLPNSPRCSHRDVWTLFLRTLCI